MSIVEREKLDVILADHHSGPVSYQAEDLSSPLNFSELMKRPDTGLIRNEREKKDGYKTGWNETLILWLLISGGVVGNNLLSVQFSC